MIGHAFFQCWSQEVLIRFKRLYNLSDVEFIAGITKINFASLMTPVRWLLILRFFKISAIVRTEMMSSPLQYSEIVSSCTWNRLSSKSLRYIDKTSPYSGWKSSPFATLIRFTNLVYVLKSCWSKRSVIALVIQSRAS